MNSTEFDKRGSRASTFVLFLSGRDRIWHTASFLVMSLLMIGCQDMQVVVHNTAPAVTITAPSDGGSLYPGLITFQGRVADSQEDAADLNVLWIISGTDNSECPSTPEADGSVQCAMELEAGQYQLTLLATDRDNAVGQAEVNFTVKNDRPTATISPPDRTSYFEGESVLLEGYVSDPEEPPSALTVTWASSLNGTLEGTAPDSEGYVSTRPSDLVPGEHQISLTAVDPLGRSGTDQVDLTIVACPDADGDGFSTCQRYPNAIDCDDDDPLSYPGAIEFCDDIDNNCDHIVDEGFDQDQDGYRTDTCDLPETPLDCDDQNPSIHPEAPEQCNTVDDNCNGEVDEEVDGDSDGLTPCDGDCDDGDPDVYEGALEVCDGKDNDCNDKTDEGFDVDGDGVTSCGGDCNDQNTSIHPGALEFCNRIDDDCDGKSDEDFDKDGDGHTTCGEQAGEEDCDDSANTIYPGADELCDGVDENCDGLADDGLLNACGECGPEPEEVCDGVDNDCNGKVDDGFDLDADGFTTCDGDCDDTRDSVNPNATERCNGRDDDCNGAIDEGFDVDGDGTTSCGGDCVDSDSSIHPGATERCNTLDDDCDGSVDEDFDTDHDGYRNCGSTDRDCDDSDASVNPGANEVCDGFDNDCDGFVDEGFDQDGDGYKACVIGTIPADCNDLAFAINPGVAESCDGVDNNCNNEVDEGFDQDGDLYTSCGGDCDDTRADVNPSKNEVCNGRDDNCRGGTDEGFDRDQDGVTTCAGDCNDNSAAIKPGITEVCNDVDDDCDNSVDEGFDADADNYKTCKGDCNDGNAAIHPNATETCNHIDDDCDGTTDEGFDKDGDNYTTCSGDCNDSNSGIHPNAIEWCDGIDNDCDNAVDEEFDADGDGYTNCAGDCDDENAAIYPLATEVCNGVDDDCDEAVDEGFDADGDGFAYCTDDCDDTNRNIHPGQTETCNSTDDNCNGQVDEGLDGDNDGYTSCQGDCNNTNSSIHPNAHELCDGIDNDCDGSVDEGLTKTYYLDADGDGYGTTTTTQACVWPDGYVMDSTDCNDNDSSSFPGAPEGSGDADGNGVVDGDGRDNDCDGVVDEGTDLYDDDSDGYTEHEGDCNDVNPSINPAAAEGVDRDGDGLPDPDGVDNNCDGRVDEGTINFDDDGDGWAEVDGDCDDASSYTYPGAPERFDGQDNDCDGALEDEIDLANTFSFLGVQAGSMAGFSVAGPGDINGSGYGAVVIGAPGLNGGKGAAHVVLTQNLVWDDDMDLAPHSVTLWEDTPDAAAGYSLAPGGDLNADGLRDFVIGAPYYSSDTLTNAGIAYIIFGRSTGWANSLVSDFATSAVKAVSSENYLATSLAGGEDVNGDGISDVLIGVPWPEGSGAGAGWTLVLPGKTRSWSPSLAPNDLAKLTGEPREGVGYSVAITGYTTSDNYADIVIGGLFDTESRGDAWFVNGRSDMKSGSLLGPSELGGTRYRGVTSSEFVGAYVAAAGDVDGDGFDDFLVGRATTGNQVDARAYLYRGPTVPSSGTAETTAPVKFYGGAEDVCPCNVAGLGDVDGDGYADIAIGVTQNTERNGGGKVYLFYGGPPGTFSTSMSLDSADMPFYGETDGDETGTALVPLGDLNDDGYDDFAIGAPYNSQAGASAGKVFILFGHPRE